MLQNRPSGANRIGTPLRKLRRLIQVIAFISAPDVARRILDHLGLASRAPPLAGARAPDDPGGSQDPGPGDQAGDPTYDQ